MTAERYVNGRRIVDAEQFLTLGVQPYPTHDRLAETRVSLRIRNAEFPTRVRDAVDEPDGAQVLQEFLTEHNLRPIPSVRHFRAPADTNSGEKEPHGSWGIELAPEQLQGIQSDLVTTARMLPSEYTSI